MTLTLRTTVLEPEVSENVAFQLNAAVSGHILYLSASLSPGPRGFPLQSVVKLLMLRLTYGQRAGNKCLLSALPEAQGTLQKRGRKNEGLEHGRHAVEGCLLDMAWPLRV